MACRAHVVFRTFQACSCWIYSTLNQLHAVKTNAGYKCQQSVPTGEKTCPLVILHGHGSLVPSSSDVVVVGWDDVTGPVTESLSSDVVVVDWDDVTGPSVTEPVTPSSSDVVVVG